MNSASPISQPRQGRSRTRIGSDDARTWVRKLRLGNPFAKSILMAVANYMNEDGAAWPGIGTISQDTDIAEDTVVSRLRWCEGIGAVAIFKCWVDENGRRNIDGRGRVTSSEIRFLFDADQDEIALRAADATKPRVLRGAALAAHEAKAISPRPHGEPDEEISPRSGRELNPDGSRLAPDSPPTRADRREELEDKKDSPLPPKGGDDLEIGGAEEAKPWEGGAGWAEFEKAWHEPILRQSIARQVWSALSADERALATKAASGYATYRRSQKKPPNVINAHTFLRERDAWSGFAQHAPIPSAPIQIARHFVAVGSDEWKVLRVLLAIAGRPEPEARYVAGQDGKGLQLTTPLPAFALSLLRYAVDYKGELDTREWKIIEPKTPIGSQQIGAWRERFAECLGYPCEAWNVPTGETREMDIGWRIIPDFPVKKLGLRVPCDWPPRKTADDDSTKTA